MAPYGTKFYQVSIEAAGRRDYWHFCRGSRAHDSSQLIPGRCGRYRPTGSCFLKAQKGGVLMRAGALEAGCDLAELAGLNPSAVICEIMKDDGTIWHVCQIFLSSRKQHNLKDRNVADLIHHRSQNENMNCSRVGERQLQTLWMELSMRLFTVTCQAISALFGC